MHNQWKRSIIILLVLCIALCLLSDTAYAAECTDKPEAISFSFLNADSSANISADCYYSDEYFYQSGMRTDTHLRTLSLCMAMSAFESYRDGEDFTNRCENFEDLMIKAGFSNLYHNEAYDTRPTEDSIGIAIASKKINPFGIDYTLIAVGVRGASYGAEWASNLRVGESGPSAGFSSARDQVLQSIQDYESANGITDHAKIWISGFSRAGAVSNLVGEALNQMPLDYATTKDDIYCYTFEAPQGAEKTTAAQYPNIHNTVSTADLVPLLPLAEWGLTRIGYPSRSEETLPDGPYSQDDWILPSVGTEEYNAGRDTMLALLETINPDIDYSIENFQKLRFDFESLTSDTEISQSEFVLEFSRWIGSTLPEQTRSSYSENYETAFSTFARIMFGAPTAAVSEALKSLLKDPAFYGYLAGTVLTIQTRALVSEEEYDSSLRSYGQSLGEILTGHMNETGILLSEEDTAALIDTVYPIIRFTDTTIEDDFLNHSGYHIATLLSNLMPLVQSHCPEISLAWLETYDSYYTPSRFTPHQIRHVEGAAATCTVNGNTEYWICGNCETVYADADLSLRSSLQDTVLPAIGHNWNNGVITKAPTTKMPGVRTYICLNCGELRTEEIERLPITPAPSPAEETIAAPTKKPVPSEAPVQAGTTDNSRHSVWLVCLLILLILIILLLFFLIFRTYLRKRDKTTDQ